MLRRALHTAPGERLALFTWGAGVAGALGHGSEYNERLPRRVEDLALEAALSAAGSDCALACGLFHYAVRAGSRVFLFGRGAGGRLGLGDESSATRPTELGGLAPVAGLALGGLHSVFLTRAGGLLAAGFGGWGALGRGDYLAQHAPAAVAGLPVVAHVAAGGAHTLAVDTAGGVWAWGRDEGEGRLGVASAARTDGGSNVPLAVPLPAALAAPCTAAAGGGFHSLLLAGGGVLSFGGNANGELGRMGPSWKAALVPGLPPIAHLAAGGFHSAALTADGELYTWGHGGAGALGHGSRACERSPRRVGGPLEGVVIRAVACGGASTYVVTGEGAVWHWGKNQVSLGSTSGDVLVPRQVAVPHRALAVAAGSAHAALLCAVPG